MKNNFWEKYQSTLKLEKSKMPVVTDEKQINQALERGVNEIIGGKDELKKYMLAGEKLRLYTGIDPTAAFLHVGHFIWMRKLAQFQKLGHEVIFLIGGFTAMIGDPDKLAERKPLTKEQVWENFKNYKDTASKIINFDWDENPVTILNNYDWLSKLNLEEWLSVMSNVTMQHILSHDMFAKRIKEHLPIRLHEIMYPLMQGFDCVAMNVDLEVGGSDQRFNMYTGRVLTKNLQNKDKFVMTMKLLTDNEGSKMGKTTGNAISSLDKDEEMFGKIMSWSDENLLQSFELLTDENLDEIQKEIKAGNFMNLKKKLAFEVVKLIKGEDNALKAQEYFEKTVQHKELPDLIEEIEIPKKINALDLGKYLVEKEHITTNSEAKRMIEQGGIQINGKKIDSISAEIKFDGGEIIKIGKRKFVKIKVLD